MRKIIYILFILIISSISSNAQFTFGMRYGLNYSAFIGAIENSVDGRQAGLYIERSILNRNIVLCIEFNRSKLGGELNNLIVKPVSDDYPYYSYDYNIMIDYFEVPLIIKVYRKREARFNFQPFIGISKAFPVSQKTSRTNMKLVSENGPIDYDITGTWDRANQNDLVNIILGFSYRYRKIILDVRYNQSLKNIEGAGSEAEINYKPVSISVSLGFVFGTQASIGTMKK